MPLHAIEQILNRKIGLDAASIGAPAVARAVHARMSARQLRQPGDYLERLRDSPEELQALVETVVVPETWFFRHREAFACVAAMAVGGWLANPARPPMRLLSAPCSTGEEPHSLAMTLIDAGLPTHRFSIDGVDISERALERARQGIYGKNSFRGADLDFRARHFAPTPHGYRIGEAVRACVHLRQANLLALPVPAPGEAYDVVFCRNLLIYFDPATQRRAIEILRRLLAPEGLLFVGPGEANLLLGADFAPARIPQAFAFRRAPPAAPSGPAAGARRPALRVVSPVAAPPPRRRAFTQAKPAPGPVAPQKPDLAEIRRLADRGHLADAARACEEHLRHGEPAAEAWRLLGLLRDASGRGDEAADCYRKALYLDPGDRESLEHLALLLERRGDVTGAKRVSARALRLRRKETA